MERTDAAERQKRFALAYCRSLDTYKAALQAGYGSVASNEDAVRIIGRQLLKKPSVIELINLEFDRVQSRNDGLIDQIVDELRKIAFFDIRQIYNEDNTLKNITDIHAEIAACIAGVDSATMSSGRGDEKEWTTIKKVKTHDKIKALEILAKMTGAIKPDVKITLNADGRGGSDEPSKTTVVFVDNTKQSQPASDGIEYAEVITTEAKQGSD